jgi:hypothetical protein
MTALVNKVMRLRVSEKMGNFFAVRATISSRGTVLLRGVIADLGNAAITQQM